MRRLVSGNAGATLVELVLVIVISSIMAGLIASFIRKPVEAYAATRLRAQLVDRAENALHRMARDVRAALPNTLRVSGQTLELLHTADGGRYRSTGGVNPSTQDHTAAVDVLDFAGADTQFNLLGRFRNLPFSYGTPLAAGHRLAVYPTDPNQTWANAAAGTNPGVITPAGTTITISDDADEEHLTLSSGFQFAFTSPRQRVFVVDTPVTYDCDTGAGTLMRYWGYAASATQPTNPAVAPLSAGSQALVSETITACNFTYDAGTPARAGLLTLALTVASANETVRLLHQVHLVNVP